MSGETTRRSFLGTVGAITGALTVGPRVVGASPSEDRYIVDMSTTDADAMGDVSMVHDLSDETGYVVVKAEESAIPSDARYMPDMEVELERPVEERDSDLNADDGDVNEFLYELQWDKQEQRINRVHEVATGEGARIGVLDDGVLGANPDADFAHPDLPNVRADLSFDFTNDGNGPGPLNDDHGTHVAGTAAAGDGFGVVGVAPDAEVVDLRVFSGRGANTGDIFAALIVGAGSEDSEFTVTIGNSSDKPTETTTVSGADCDVLNCSFGIPPSIPASETDQGPFTFIGPYLVLPQFIIDILQAIYARASAFARDNGALPVASAGNSGINMDAPVSSDKQPEPFQIEGIDVDPTNLPAEAPGFLTVGAAGPIGFGWPVGPNAEEVISGSGVFVEQPFQTELPTEEPALYTNYGAEAVDVTAGGGNADIDAIGEGVNWFYDLVFSTGIINLDPEKDEDVRLSDYEPGYVWKAGTSFSAPNAAGLAALLFGADAELSPDEVADVIRNTAEQRPIGQNGESTAPASLPNVAFDGKFDGDTASNPGSAPDQFDSQTYRGAGHINVAGAVEEVTGEDIESDGEDDSGGRGR